MSNENNNNKKEVKRTKTSIIRKAQENENNKVNKKIQRRSSVMIPKDILSSLEDLKTTSNMDDSNESNNKETLNKEVLKKGLLRKSGKIKKKKGKKKKNLNSLQEPVLLTEIKPEIIKKIEPEKKESIAHKFLRNKLEKLNFSKNMQLGIKLGFDKINIDVKDNLIDNINIKEKKIDVDNIINNPKKMPELNLGKNGILYNITKESIARLKLLKEKEKNIKNKLNKLEENQKIIESERPIKGDIVNINLKNHNLKKLNSMKNQLFGKLKYNTSMISEVIENDKSINRNLLIRNYNNHSNKNDLNGHSKHFSLSEDQEKFNNYLRKRQIEEKLQREEIQKKFRKFQDQKNKEIELNENKILKKQKEHLNELKKKEKYFFDKLKEKNNLIMEKSFKNIKNKDKNNMKQTKDYFFYQAKQKFENNKKKLVDKVNMMKKDPLVTKQELEELALKRQERKQILEEGLTERKINLMKMWKQRSKNIPIYKHPIVNIIEDEQLDIMEDKQEKQERKEQNEQIKKNYQPPKVKINLHLKLIREKKYLTSNKDSVIQTEANNKKKLLKNLDFMANIIEAAKEEEMERHKNKSTKNINKNKNIENDNKNNRIRFAKSLDPDEKIKKHNYQLHPKPEKPFDYLKQLMKIKKNQKKEQGVGDILTEINTEDKIKGRNQISDTVDLIKSRTNAIDQKVIEKKEYMKVKGGYIKNTNLGDEVGNLLIESIQTKLSLLNKLKGK